MELPNIYLILGIFAVTYVYRSYRHSRYRRPPGPSGYPIVGNTYDVPASHEWVWYRELSRNYNSDIIYLNMFGTPLYVLNSFQAAQDLFDKRSAIYSDRPSYTMLNDLVGYTWHFAFMRYGDDWKVHRALFHKEFQPPASLYYNPQILNATRGLLQQLITHPDGFNSHLRHMAGRIILSTAYGITPLLAKDPYIDISERALKAMAAAGNAGSFLVDSLPWLKHIPGDWEFKKKARAWREPVEAMPKVTLEFVKRSMKEGTAKSSIASRNLQAMEDDGSWTADKERVLSNVLAAMYAAGADTTVSALGTFIIAMVMYPEVQKKGQAAVGAAIGTGRLPDFSDLNDIPYVDAIMKEVLRWKPVTPLAVIHTNVVDDVYRGYYIPAGSLVVGNSWAMLYDNDTYGSDPEVFRPDRFMKDGTNELDENVPHPDVAFGFGRRICAGQNMAQLSLWITMASMLASFDIVPAKDENGVPIMPSVEYTSGLVSYPKPFQCEIRPRNDGVVQLIKQGLDHDD